MEFETSTLAGEGGGTSRKLRIGHDVLMTTQVADQFKVSVRTVERWVTKEKNALPAIRVTAAQLYEMGYRGNLHSSREEYFLIRKADLALIPAVRQYPRDTKRPNRGRRGTISGARAPERQ